VQIRVGETKSEVCGAKLKLKTMQNEYRQLIVCNIGIAQQKKARM
jgi:hypothetical protein